MACSKQTYERLGEASYSWSEEFGFVLPLMAINTTITVVISATQSAVGIGIVESWAQFHKSKKKKNIYPIDQSTNQILSEVDMIHQSLKELDNFLFFPREEDCYYFYATI